MEEITKEIGEKIRKAREERGLTQKDLGEHLGYTPMGISHFEKGIRGLKVNDLKKLADYLGKDLSYFLASSAILFRAENHSPHQAEMKKSVDAFEQFLNEQSL